MAFQTKEDQVAEFLREGIIGGRFARGEKLKQVEIAELLGTSVTPVREALKLLEAEGYVRGASHRGAVVAPFEIESVEEIVELRVALEGRLMAAALKRVEKRDIDELIAVQAELDRAVEERDREAVRPLNYRFHQRLYAVADQPQTLEFVRILWAKYPFDVINRIAGRIERAASEHRAILKAMTMRDEVAALSALTEHLRSGWIEYRGSATAQDEAATGRD